MRNSLFSKRKKATIKKLIKIKRSIDNKVYVFLIIIAILVFCSNPGISWAKVTGICSNCHTMHNSQNNDALAMSGGAAWNGSGVLTGGTSSSALSNLLITDCVGCHSSTTSDTILAVSGGSDIPIVYNMTEPTKPLAGGNFYWVAQGEAYDGMGHNVYGISEEDSVLSEAPGRLGGCANSCHMSLAVPPAFNEERAGCQGCHVFVAHHDDSRPWYRFLKSHSDPPGVPIDPDAIDGGDYVLRTTNSEDVDWEFTSSSSDHNFYKGTGDPYPVGPGLTNTKTITAFCAGCHGSFHGAKLNGYGMGSELTGWIRHPTDILLPETSEYGGYNPVTNYSVEAPVAWLDPNIPARAEAVVMCLSCHRAHGSDQPDLLRWDYTGMIAGGGGSTGGCFTCHTTKDGS